VRLRAPEDVAWLEVAVREARGVELVQAGEDVAEDRQHLWTPLGESAGEMKQTTAQH
jgi:hypothetical protein